MGWMEGNQGIITTKTSTMTLILATVSGKCWLVRLGSGCKYISLLQRVLVHACA